MVDQVIAHLPGGGTQVMDLPLPDPIAQQVAAGDLRVEPIVPPESEPETKDETTETSETSGESTSGPEGPDSGTSAGGTQVHTRPGARASKAEWVEHAVSLGMDPAEAEQHTVAQLAELTDTTPPQE